MGWTFPWVSSHESDFNFDFGVSFTPEQQEGGSLYNFAPAEHPEEELPGISAFQIDDAGTVFHTYSAYARGIELLMADYQYLDLVPKGRDERGRGPFWVRRHDEYGH